MSAEREKLVLGTRGSELARAQSRMVEQVLRGALPQLEIETRIIRTSGDEDGRRTPVPSDPRFGRKGMFTGEIERALLAREIDLAVHSAKDLPSEMTAALEIGAVLRRAPVGDVLVSKHETLGSAAVIGTSSVRRQHQVRAKWPQARTAELRGNVPTRLRKLEERDDLDAIILARAGLERLGLSPEFHTAELPLDEFVPAGGQGIIALQIRSDDAACRELLAQIDHSSTRLCLRAEREFLRLLQGDCNSPVGVLATSGGGKMTLRAQVFDNFGAKPRAGETERNEDVAPEELAAAMFEKLNG